MAWFKKWRSGKKKDPEALPAEAAEAPLKEEEELAKAESARAQEAEERAAAPEEAEDKAVLEGTRRRAAGAEGAGAGRLGLGARFPARRQGRPKG